MYKKAILLDCLKKNPAERPTATELMKNHAEFFAKAVPQAELAKEFLTGMPKLEERVCFVYIKS